MKPAFFRKMAANGDLAGGLPDEDRALLLSLCDDVRAFGARRNIIREGERPEHVQLMIEGWSCRYKVLRDGSRQITAFLVPGDFSDTHVTLFDRMDHSIAAVTNSRVAFVPHAKMTELAERPHIMQALWWASMIDASVLRAWIVNLGRRNAFERVGHLMCEMHARLRSVGLVEGDEFELPLTQKDIGDALGLTSIHVNRMLRELREAQLVTFREHRIVLPDVTRLRKLVGFDAGYLHLPKEPFVNEGRPGALVGGGSLNTTGSHATPERPPACL